MIDNIIISKRACTGCSSCYNVCPKSAIKMGLVDGFYKATIDKLKCVSCHKCISVCPQNNEVELNTFESQAFACKSNDKTIQMISTSGGAFSILANTILHNHGVIYGAAFDENLMVKHIRVAESYNMRLLSRTKYVQSFLGDTFKQVEQDLISGNMVLFSGTPCQCFGLRSFLKRGYDNLIVIGVLCHGAPSPTIWKNYLKYRQKKCRYSKNIIESSFRNKDTDLKANWHNSYMYIKFDNKEYSHRSKSDPYVKMFASYNVSINECCFECKYRNPLRLRGVDITLGDFWGIEHIIPSFDDKNGVSLLIIHSQNGKKIFNECKQKISYIQVDPKQALESNAAFIQPKSYKLNKQIKNALIKYQDKFGLIYHICFPILYVKKIIDKIEKLLKKRLYKLKNY